MNDAIVARTAAAAQGSLADSLGITIESCKVCSLSSAEIASDSEFESARRANKVGVSGETLARFWAKVSTHPTESERYPGIGHCWTWTGSCVIGGYGQFVLERDLYGKQAHVIAHRFAYQLVHGVLESRRIKACHRCDNRRCVRPSHLFLGSQQDNLNDARRKGRLVDGLGARKISDDAYREILTTPYAHGSGIALARKFGVTKNTIWRIRHGRQGATYRRSQVILEPVPFVQVPVRGELHVGNDSRSSIALQHNSLVRVSR